jgi:hypothetical protein
MTEPEQFLWAWHVVRIVVPILLVILAIRLLFASLARRRDQRHERLKQAKRLIRTTAAATARGDRPSTIATGSQSLRRAADIPRNPRKRNRQKQVGNERSKSNAGRRPT